MMNSTLSYSLSNHNECLITGATGYIGSQLAKYLLENGWRVHIIIRKDSTLKNLQGIEKKLCYCLYDGSVDSIIKYFIAHKIDVVFHLAALVLSSHQSEQVTSLIRSNIEFGTQVLEAMKATGVKYIVSTGTYWQNFNTPNYCPVDLYAATKEAFEKIIQYYTDAHFIKAITLRLFDVYGPNDNRPKLLNYLKKIAGTDTSIDVSPGEQKLDMVYIRDVCSAYEKAYELLVSTGINNSVFGVYTGTRYTLRTIVSFLSNVTHKNFNVNFGGKPYKEREIMEPINSLHKLPNWSAEFGIMEGLKRIYDEFI